MAFDINISCGSIAAITCTMLIYLLFYFKAQLELAILLLLAQQLNLVCT